MQQFVNIELFLIERFLAINIDGKPYFTATFVNDRLMLDLQEHKFINPSEDLTKYVLV